jgi:hypothetical protein
LAKPAKRKRKPAAAAGKRVISVNEDLWFGPGSRSVFIGGREVRFGPRLRPRWPAAFYRTPDQRPRWPEAGERPAQPLIKPAAWFRNAIDNYPQQLGEGPSDYARRLLEIMKTAPVTKQWKFTAMRRRLYRY